MLTNAASVPELVAWLTRAAETADGVQTVLVTRVRLLTLIHICKRKRIDKEARMTMVRNFVELVVDGEYVLTWKPKQ